MLAAPAIVEYGSTFRTPISGIVIARDGTVWVQECNGVVRLNRNGGTAEFRRHDSGPEECYGTGMTLAGPAVWSNPGDALLETLRGDVKTIGMGGEYPQVETLAALGTSIYYSRYASGSPGFYEIRAGQTRRIAFDQHVDAIAASGDALWIEGHRDSSGTLLTLWHPGAVPPAGVAATLLQARALTAMGPGPGGSLVAATVAKSGASYAPATIVRIDRDGAVREFGQIGRGGSDAPTIGSIAYAPNGGVWFTEPSRNRVARLSPDGTVREFRDGIPDGVVLSGIAVDTDGSAWATDSFRNTVEHVGTDGRVRVYGNGLSPITIPAGPVVTADGAAWYVQTLDWHERITRLAPDGTYREFAVPAGVSESVSGALEPIGNGVAFAINASPALSAAVMDERGNVSTIDLDGCVASATNVACFPNGKGLRLPALQERPQSVAMGPDGNMWLTDTLGSRIGRLSRDGTIRWYSRGLVKWASGPQYITRGPDGAMWFTEIHDRVGRIDTNGKITDFRHILPFRCFPGGIVSGRDGNLWFTIYHGNELVRITPSGAVTRFRNGIYPSRGNDSDVPDSVPFVDGRGRIWFNEPQGGRIARATIPL